MCHLKTMMAIEHCNLPDDREVSPKAGRHVYAGDPIAYVAESEAELDEAKSKAGGGGNGASPPPPPPPAAEAAPASAAQPVAAAVESKVVSLLPYWRLRRCFERAGTDVLETIAPLPHACIALHTLQSNQIKHMFVCALTEPGDLDHSPRGCVLHGQLIIWHLPGWLQPAPAAAEQAPPPPPPPPPAAAPQKRADGRIIATPYAKKLAKVCFPFVSYGWWTFMCTFMFNPGSQQGRLCTVTPNPSKYAQAHDSIVCN